MTVEALRAATHTLNGWVERRAVVLVALLVTWLGMLLCVFARAKPFWHDEVYTIVTSQLPLATLGRAYLDGVDLSPPLNTLLTHGLHATAGVGRITTRLPAMIGLLIAVVLLGITVRRRTNGTAGVVAGLIPCFTAAWAYGIEARGYGLTLGLFAAALYGWSEAAAGRRPGRHWALMAAALAGGVWTHYYAVLAFLPILAGEAVRQARQRRLHVLPWVALVLAAVALVPLVPLVAVAARQRDTFWTRAETPGLGSTYAFLLGDLLTFRTLSIVLVLVVAGEAVRRIRTGRATRHLAAHDIAACVTCVALPAVGVLLGEASGVFTERYVVFAAVGLGFALAQLVWWMTPDSGIGDSVTAAALVWALIGLTARFVVAPPEWRDPNDYHPLLTQWIANADADAGPIAMTGGVAFLGVWYNLPDDARSRVVYLADPVAQLHVSGTDTIDRGYLALARWTPVPVASVGDFARVHDHFMLYSFGAAWAEQSLASMNATMVPRAGSPANGAVIYEVSLSGR